MKVNFCGVRFGQIELPDTHEGRSIRNDAGTIYKIVGLPNRAFQHNSPSTNFDTFDLTVPVTSSEDGHHSTRQLNIIFHPDRRTKHMVCEQYSPYDA